MIIPNYTVNDFRVGESVVPVNLSSVILVVVEIDKEAGKVICRMSEDSQRVEHEFAPHELQKEPFVHPPNIVDLGHPDHNTNAN